MSEELEQVTSVTDAAIEQARQTYQKEISDNPEADHPSPDAQDAAPVAESSPEPAAKEDPVKELSETTEEPTSTTEAEDALEEVEVPDFGFNKEEGEEQDDSRGEEFDETAFDKETEAELEGMNSDKERVKWKELKSEIKELKKNALSSQREEDIEAELQELRDKAARVEEVEQLNKRLTDQSYKLEVENSREYQEAFELPVQEVANEIEVLAEQFGVDKKKLANAVAETNLRKQADKIRNLMDDEDEEGNSNAHYQSILASKVPALANKYDSAYKAQDKLMENAKDSYEKSQLARAEEAKAQTETQQKLHRVEVDKIADRFEGVPLSDDNKAALNRAIKEAKGMSPGSLPTQDGAYAVTAGVALPVVLKELVQAQAKIDSLEGKSRRKAQSSSNLSDGSPKSDKTPDVMPTRESLLSKFGLADKG